MMFGDATIGIAGTSLSMVLNQPVSLDLRFHPED